MTEVTVARVIDWVMCVNDTAANTVGQVQCDGRHLCKCNRPGTMRQKCIRPGIVQQKSVLQVIRSGIVWHKILRQAKYFRCRRQCCRCRCLGIVVQRKLLLQKK